MPARAQSARPGWGAIPYHTATSNGVTFRVWAPNATSVFVPGQFNNWSTSANPLAHELTNGVWDGIWSADINNATNGQQYKYYLNYNGSGTWKHDPCARKMVNASDASGANDYIYDPAAFNWSNDIPVAPGLSNLVIYELHIGTFYNPNSGSSLPGTFLNATNRLDYLKNLGVSAVEVLPIAEFPAYFDWGYDPAGLYAADNYAYGGPDGFKTFVQACHKRGLAVLLDVIHNHYGPTDLDLWDFDGWTGTNSGGGIYFYQDPNLCCTPYGSRPNFSRAQVQNYILQNFQMWLSECHVDGFRWDTPGLMMNDGSTYIPEAATLITNINYFIQTNYSTATNAKVNIAEDVMGYGFNSTWDTTFPYAVTPVLTNTVDANRDLNILAGAVLYNQRFGSAAGLNRVAFLESHDVVGDLNSGIRLVTNIDPGAPGSWRARKLSTLGATLTFTVPGIPMVFQGQEMLENQAFSSSRPVDWSKTNTYSGMVTLYHDLIRLRRNLDNDCPGLLGNPCSVLQLDNTRKVLAYQRGSASQAAVVILNCSGNILTNYSLPFPQTGNWYLHFNTDWTNYGGDFSDTGAPIVTATGSPAAAAITIGPYSAQILSLIPLAPQLTITRTTTNTTVLWSTNFNGWQLQSATGINGNNWSPIAPSQFQTNTSGIQYSVPGTNPNTFFRLYRPR